MHYSSGNLRILDARFTFGRKKRITMEKEQETFQPELYTEQEIECIETHITRYFGKFEQVFHEIVSPDIHVDIAILPPIPGRNYYTLITMGMGAHRMHVPEELAGQALDRAEMMICLPPDWEIHNQDEKWYWPLRWLKIMARLPIEQDTWLGWGHTVPNGEPVAENTLFSCMLLINPAAFDEEAAFCKMPDGSEVNFYQLIPLYEEEMNFKLANTAETLLDKMNDNVLVVDIDRPNFCALAVPRTKNFKLSANEIEPLLPGWKGPEGCIATDRITVDGCPVGYMYREEPDEEVPDNGWRFLAGDEDEAYMDNAANSSVYSINTICNYDRDIIPFLDAPYGSAFYRDENGVFREETE